MKKVPVIVLLFAVCNLLLSTCKWQLDIKDFIATALATAQFKNDFHFNRSTVHDAIPYIQSGIEIELTIPIGNRFQQPLSGTAAVSDDDKGMFAVLPHIKELTPQKAVISFTLNETAEPDRESSFLSKMIPVTLILTEKAQNRDFGSYSVMVHCNTAPAVPSGFSVRYDRQQDAFVFPLLNYRAGIHADVTKLTAVISIEDTAGSKQVKSCEIPLTDNLPTGQQSSQLYTIYAKNSGYF